jgi:hypothetical protein
MAIGDAFINVHADTDPFEDEIDDAVDRIADDAEKQVKKQGKEIGDDLVDSTAAQVEKTAGKEIGRSLERSVGRQKVRTKIRVEYDREGNEVRRFVDTIVDEIHDAFDAVNQPGGPIQRIGSGIADAIGAGFNVSGRSPLIAFLIPLIGVVIALVAGAAQAVGALIALLGSLPTLLGAIGLQVGVLVIAFQGIGEAIQGAFAAKNPKELAEALKGLTPHAQEFVKSLLPVRDLFKEIQKSVQDNFFKRFGQVLADMAVILGGLVKPGFARLARALGDFFNALGNFFLMPSFLNFVNRIFPETIQFLQTFGPSFIAFIGGLIDVANASLPFLKRFGKIFSGIFEHIGTWLSDMAHNKEFQDWLNDMASTLDAVVELFFTLMGFVKTFLDQLNQAGGRNIIMEFADAFSKLIFFLETPVGQKAMEGIVNLSIISIRAVTGLIIIILSLVAAIQRAAEFWVMVFDKVANFFSNTIPEKFAIVKKFLTSDVPAWFGGLKDKVGTFLSGLGTKIADKFKEALPKIVGFFGDILTEIRGWPGRIINQLGYLGTLLLNQGRQLINGLIQGIRDRIPDLNTILFEVARAAVNIFPHSPAKIGPLSGSGDTLYAGKEIINRLATGIISEEPTLNMAYSTVLSPIADFPGSFTAPPAAPATTLGDQYTTVIVEIDGQQLEGRIVRVMNDRDRRLRQRVAAIRPTP